MVEAALRAGRGGADVIAVTDDPDGPLAEHAQDVWHIGAAPPAALQQTDYESAEAQQYVGYHHDVAQTKSFLAVVLTIARAADPESDDWDGLAEHIAALTAEEFTRPIRELAEVARRIHRGELDVRARVDSHDEVAELAETFNETIEALVATHRELEIRIANDAEKPERKG